MILSLRADQDYYAEARTYLPWSARPAITSGFYGKARLILPVNVHASFDMLSQEIQLSIEPTNTEKVRECSVMLIKHCYVATWKILDWKSEMK